MHLRACVPRTRQAAAFVNSSRPRSAVAAFQWPATGKIRDRVHFILARARVTTRVRKCRSSSGGHRHGATCRCGTPCARTLQIRPDRRSSRACPGFRPAGTEGSGARILDALGGRARRPHRLCPLPRLSSHGGCGGYGQSFRCHGSSGARHAGVCLPMTDALMGGRLVLRPLRDVRAFRPPLAPDTAALHHPGAGNAPRWCTDWFLRRLSPIRTTT